MHSLDFHESASMRDEELESHYSIESYERPQVLAAADESSINDTKEDITDLKEPIYKTRSNQNEPDINNAPPYSRFDAKYKMALVLQCAYTGLFSTMAGAIYYPVLSVIEKDFHITEEMVNITVVVYFIFQGLAPTLMGGLADSLGRRPVVLFAIIVYFCACVGLACAKNYSQIVGLRCLQAAGISPVIAINSGIIGDVTTRAERGGYVGLISGFQVLGSAFGALIGAGLSSTWDWRAIFWFLAIGSGACLVLSAILLPETKRTIVGNGSITPHSYVNKAPALAFPVIRKKLHLDNPEYETLEPKVELNLFAPLYVLRIKEIAILLYTAGVQFALWSTHQTALSTVLSKKYHLSVAKIGLCYLPTGICTLISIVSSGRYLNWSYRRRAAKHKEWLKVQEKELLEANNYNQELVKEIMRNDPKYVLNIVKVRLHAAFYTLMLSSSGFICFGWCIDVKAHLAAVLVMSGFASLFSNCILTMSTTLIVDIFPSKTSTATGCLNLFRCLLAALFIGCLSKMTKSMTYGGVFTFLGVLTAISSVPLFYLVNNGKKIAFTRKKLEEEAVGAASAEKVKQESADIKNPTSNHG
ncbi:Quinidine resistance protein 1 [Nakaseomyces bracarensis]|uniref:Quinidine resistance protein 1 n=1 Tax=Nakaseomyces bracarensis TaxID=273131 RepID=A0ABR4NZF0_9SACH